MVDSAFPGLPLAFLVVSKYHKLPGPVYSPQMGMHLSVIPGDQGLRDAWCLVRAKSPMSFNIPWAVVLKVSHLHPTPAALVPPEFVRQAKTQVPQMD